MRVSIEQEEQTQKKGFLAANGTPCEIIGNNSEIARSDLYPRTGRIPLQPARNNTNTVCLRFRKLSSFLFHGFYAAGFRKPWSSPRHERASK